MVGCQWRIQLESQIPYNDSFKWGVVTFSQTLKHLWRLRARRGPGLLLCVCVEGGGEGVGVHGSHHIEVC